MALCDLGRAARHLASVRTCVRSWLTCACFVASAGGGVGQTVAENATLFRVAQGPTSVPSACDAGNPLVKSCEFDPVGCETEMDSEEGLHSKSDALPRSDQRSRRWLRARLERPRFLGMTDATPVYSTNVDSPPSCAESNGSETTCFDRFVDRFVDQSVDHFADAAIEDASSYAWAPLDQIDHMAAANPWKWTDSTSTDALPPKNPFRKDVAEPTLPTSRIGGGRERRLASCTDNVLLSQVLLTVAESSGAVDSDEEIAPPAPVAPTFRPMQALLATAALPPGLLPDDENGDLERRLSGDRTEATESDERLGAGWSLRQLTWAPTNACHQPLYFEQVNLERHGYTMSHVLQPVLSGAHFFAVIPTLPYKMTVDRPCQCIYTLGYYRPGSPTPRRWHGIPWDHRAAAVEAATAVGLILLLP